ncbi:MAG: energy transducer TonB [Bacteroidales bacterium]|nr:energy transducer TonB [Bacteroidales bacterium]MDY4520540.1 energy transducer TonB [Bacteroidales bacterium]
MEPKKSPKADLESKKGLFKEIGLAVALGLTLAAFEWSSSDAVTVAEQVTEEAVVEEDIIPVTTQDEIKPPPPPPPPPVADALTIVEDDTEIADDFDLQDTEATDATEVEFRPVETVEVEEEEETSNEVFIIVEQMPVFPGGEAALRKFLATEVKYPVIAQENGIQGRVYVKFVIAADGSVTNVEVARPFDPNLDKEAVRVVKSMPKWTPGKQRGKAVKVSYTVPINFVLQ